MNDRERLEDSITFIVEHAPTTSRTTLMKLLYLSDLRSLEIRHERLTGLRWTWHNYGPFAGEVYQVVNDMQVDDELLVEVTSTFYGNPTYRMRSGKNAGYWQALSPDDQQILLDVIQEFGSVPAQILARLTYQTLPIETAQRRGQELDFSEYLVGSPPRFVPDFNAPPSPKMRT